MTLIILVYSGSACAFEDNIGASNPITETVFDQMVAILIPLILIAKPKYNDKNKIILKALRSIILVISIVAYSLKIWFCVRIYKITQDYFFISYLITILVVNITFSVWDGCIASQFFIQQKMLAIVVVSAFFAIHLIFFFLAAHKNYVDLSTYPFILVPITIAFIIAVVMIIFVIKNIDDDNDAIVDLEGISNNLKNLKNPNELKYFRKKVLKDMTSVDFGKYNRPMWIVCFCSELVFCSIVGPSILWIKAYITLGFVLYVADDSYKELKRAKEEKNKRKKLKERIEKLEKKLEEILNLKDVKKVGEETREVKGQGTEEEVEINEEKQQ